MTQFQIEHLTKSLALYPINYENLTILGVLTCIENGYMGDFCDIYDLIAEAMCNKNQKNPTCIDLLFKNQPCSFANLKQACLTFTK